MIHFKRGGNMSEKLGISGKVYFQIDEIEGYTINVGINDMSLSFSDEGDVPHGNSELVYFDPEGNKVAEKDLPDSVKKQVTKKKL